MAKIAEIFVIKIGGELIGKAEVFKALCTQIAKLKKNGMNIVVIHGGGSQINEMEAKLGKTPNIVNGRRITDETTLETIKMVIAGKINIEILSALQCHGITAVGLSGVDGNLLQVRRRPPKTIINTTTQQTEVIDYGFVADIFGVNPELLFSLLNNNFLPVIAPLAADKQGIVYNINADTVAQAIALALKAKQWIILSNIDGVHDHDGAIMTHLTCTQARALLNTGVITNGMIPKVESILLAIESGIASVHIINGLKPEKLASLGLAETLGTLITKERLTHEPGLLSNRITKISD
jgi:acetylglutamate kinase